MNDIPGEYYPEIFNVTDIGQAKYLILTPAGGMTSEERWQTETAYLLDLIADASHIGEDTVVLDFGCGVGRMAKALIERFGCWVIGVDMSASMRQLAPGYVQSPRFSVISPLLLDVLVARGFRADLGIAIWVIQHVARPDQDVARLAASIASNGGLFVANNIRRAVPTDRGWADDGIDVATLLAPPFEPLWHGRLPREIGGDVLPEASWLAAYRRP
jgi:SAM-dependent methyltransferase